MHKILTKTFHCYIRQSECDKYGKQNNARIKLFDFIKLLTNNLDTFEPLILICFVAIAMPHV